MSQLDQNNAPKRLIDQIGPPHRSSGYWIAGVGVGVAVVMGFMLLRSGRDELQLVQTTTISTAVVPAKTAAPPPKEERAVATPEPTAAPTPPPRRSARHAAPKIEKPKEPEPLPEFPVPAGESNH
jgi:hypothetical protein